MMTSVIKFEKANPCSNAIFTKHTIMFFICASQSLKLIIPQLNYARMKSSEDPRSSGMERNTLNTSTSCLVSHMSTGHREKFLSKVCIVTSVELREKRQCIPETAGYFLSALKICQFCEALKFVLSIIVLFVL